MGTTDREDYFEMDARGFEAVLRYVAHERGGQRPVQLGKLPVRLWKEMKPRLISMLREESDGDTGEDVREEDRVARFSLLLGRETTVLVWALMEDEAGERTETILQGWHGLAREERWWLFRRCSAPGQARGHGWRRALFYALGDHSEDTPTDSRDEIPELDEVQAPESGTQLGLFP